MLLALLSLSALLAICAGNSPVTVEFPAQKSVTRSFDVFFGLHLNKWLSKQSWGWWFVTPSHPLWRHSNDSSTWERHILTIHFTIINSSCRSCTHSRSKLCNPWPADVVSGNNSAWMCVDIAFIRHNPCCEKTHAVFRAVCLKLYFCCRLFFHRKWNALHNY